MPADPTQLPPAGLPRLTAVMAQLRAREGGCPWDLEQTLATLRTYLLEESHELVEASDGLGQAQQWLPDQPLPAVDPQAVALFLEELGDVQLQVAFQSQIASELGWFDANDVATAIADKMIRRHPHVFVTDVAPPTTPGEVKTRWEAQKRKEGKGALDGVPKSLPALLRGQRMGDKAARIGFDWPDSTGVWAKVQEELAELQEAEQSGDPARMQDELGDVLFALTSLARHLGVDAEMGLRGTLDKFDRRFRYVEREADSQWGKDHRASLDELEALWLQAKAAERV
jgi:tetrapyrrole methylase family protein/MazG family protein/ATP diphosphatase